MEVMELIIIIRRELIWPLEIRLRIQQRNMEGRGERWWILMMQSKRCVDDLLTIFLLCEGTDRFVFLFTVDGTRRGKETGLLIIGRG